MFGYTIIKKTELEELKKENKKYFDKWLEEHLRLNSLVLVALENKAN